MNKDKKRELLESLENITSWRQKEQFYKKYEIIEIFTGTVRKRVGIFSTDLSGSRQPYNWNGEYVYRVYEISTGTVVHEGYFLDDWDLIEELEEELGIW